MKQSYRDLIQRRVGTWLIRSDYIFNKDLVYTLLIGGVFVVALIVIVDLIA